MRHKSILAESPILPHFDSLHQERRRSGESRAEEKYSSRLENVGSECQFGPSTMGSPAGKALPWHSSSCSKRETNSKRYADTSIPR